MTVFHIPSEPPMPKPKPSKTDSLFLEDRIWWIPPSDLKKNPLNWRKHPREQIDALREAYAAIGFIEPIVVNSNTKNIINGHGRLEAAIKKKLKAVPVVQVNLTEEQERLHLQNADNIQALGIADTGALRKLIELNQATIVELPKTSTETLKSLHKKIDDHATILSVRKSPNQPQTIFDITDRISKRRVDREAEASEYAAKENLAEQTVYRDDVTFESDEEWGIPILLSNPKVLCIQPPLQTYDRTEDSISSESWCCYTVKGSFKKSHPDPGGTLGFFCEDYRFNYVFDKINECALTFKEEGWTNIVEPDYSVYDQDAAGNPHPFAVSLYNLYRSRYVIRYCQELGMRVLPILRWTSDDKLFDAAVSTLPTNLPWLCVQIRSSLASLPVSEIKKVEESFEDALEITQPQGLVVYGDLLIEDWVRERLPSKRTKLVMLKDYMSSRTQVRKQSKTE